MAPGWDLRRVKRDANGHLVPDFDAPPLYSVAPHPVPQGPFPPGFWDVKRDLGPDYRKPMIGHIDVAIVITAPAGVTPDSGTSYMAFHSAGERYDKAPQPSFSGRYNAATKTVEFLVPPVTTEATELSTGLCFAEPIVEFAATTSGGGDRTQGEFHFGVGAYYTDRATRGGWFRVRMEHNMLRTTQRFGIPLMATARSTPMAYLPGIDCLMDLDPADPLFTLLLQLGQFKQVQERYRGTDAWEVWHELDWMAVPADPALRGVKLLFSTLAFCPSGCTTPIWQTPSSILVELR
jgi:hypothetical protein